MEKPIFVTEVADRKPQFRGGMMVTLELWEDEGADEWWNQFGEKSSFTFKPGCYFGKEGGRLFYLLNEAIKKRDPEGVRSILPELRTHCQTNYEDLEPAQKWAHAAVQMPGDIGGPRKNEVRDIITAEARGRVLETMCGFNSYFADTPNITEVVVLDFCREMLERYAHPKRTRILYDLERVVMGEKLDFFKDGNFQTIGCWGSNYLSDQRPVFAEFNRVLSRGGRLLILESTSEGYSDLIKRYFDPEECARSMRESDFNVEIRPLPKLKTEFELGEYYLVVGVK